MCKKRDAKIRVEIDMPDGKTLKLSGVIDMDSDWSVFLSPNHQNVSLGFTPDESCIGEVSMVNAMLLVSKTKKRN